MEAGAWEGDEVYVVALDTLLKHTTGVPYEKNFFYTSGVTKFAPIKPAQLALIKNPPIPL